MVRNVYRAAAVLALLLAGAITINAQREYQGQSLDLMRFLATKPWAGRGHNRWDRGPRFDMDILDHFGTKEHWGVKPKMMLQRNDDDVSINDIESNRDTIATSDELSAAEPPRIWPEPAKRSALTTALAGRMRRQQEPPALAVLNGMGTFLDSVLDNLQTLATMSPNQRASLFADPPNVVRAPSTVGGTTSTGGGSGGGIGMRRLHALRPLRPTGNIRTYNRRSFVETDGLYPGANNHDPGLLWTGLGRR